MRVRGDRKPSLEREPAEVGETERPLRRDERDRVGVGDSEPTAHERAALRLLDVGGDPITVRLHLAVRKPLRVLVDRDRERSAERAVVREQRAQVERGEVVGERDEHRLSVRRHEADRADVPERRRLLDERQARVAPKDAARVTVEERPRRAVAGGHGDRDPAEAGRVEHADIPLEQRPAADLDERLRPVDSAGAHARAAAARHQQREGAEGVCVPDDIRHQLVERSPDRSGPILEGDDVIPRRDAPPRRVPGETLHRPRAGVRRSPRRGRARPGRPSRRARCSRGWPSGSGPR